MVTFQRGRTYTRADVMRALRVRDTGGGAWYTGLVQHGNDHYIFCGVGTSGRTGHDYHNRFDGPDLVWRGRTGSTVRQPSIRALCSGLGDVHVFYRAQDRAPFTYAGTGRVVSVRDVVPVEIRWAFESDAEEYATPLPDEVPPESNVIEGAKRTITVNAYERDPAARQRCIDRWGTLCTVCGFDFAGMYGELGNGYIHVHHLKPLAEIGAEYELNPEMDLRPVCPNCHAMLHRKRPALSIGELKALIDAVQRK